MATGGYTEDKHSKEDLDFLCSPCSAKDKIKRAEKLCETCNKYYCSNCLSYHDEIFTDHDQLGPEEFESKPVLLLPTQRCGYHRNELLQMYCRGHDRVVCKTCVSMQHRSCTDVVYIPSEVQNLLGAITPETIKTGLSTTLTTLKNDKQSMEVSLKKLRDKRNAILKSVENHGKSLKAIIDDLVNESKRETDEQYHIIEEEFQEEVTKCLENKAELEKSTNEIEHVEKQKNKPQLFVSMKKCQAKIKELLKHHADITIWKETIKLGFQLNKKIIQSLMNLKSLGSVITKHTKPSLYKVNSKKTVRVCHDGTPCCISGSCQLPDGSFLVVDRSHQKIVRLDSSCDKTTDQCPVPDVPYAVCVTGNKEAAVSLGNSHSIQFVSMGTKMALTRSIKLQHKTRGLACSQRELFVSDNGDLVYVYDTAGNPLRTLGSRSLFSGTDHISVSPNGQSIYVSN